MENLVLLEEILNTRQVIQQRRRVQGNGAEAFTTTGATKDIVFATPFASAPVILIQSTDASAAPIMTARSVTATGFQAVRSVTTTSGGTFSWLAIGPA